MEARGSSLHDADTTCFCYRQASRQPPCVWWATTVHCSQESITSAFFWVYAFFIHMCVQSFDKHENNRTHRSHTRFLRYTATFFRIEEQWPPHKFIYFKFNWTSSFQVHLFQVCLDISVWVQFPKQYHDLIGYYAHVIPTFSFLIFKKKWGGRTMIRCSEHCALVH